MAALRYAHAAGADDVVFVSADGQLLEAPTATVVWLSDGVLCTPPAAPLGILDGVTVRRLFAGAGEHGFGTEIRRGTVGRPARRGRRLAGVQHPAGGRGDHAGRQAAAGRPGRRRPGPDGLRRLT